MAQRKKNFSIILVLAASLLIGFLGGYLAGFKYGIRLTRENLSPAVSQQFRSQPLKENLNSRTMEIVRELNCICGCKMELLPCTCDELRGSKEIKQFVRGLVDKGISKPEVIDQLLRRYGQAILTKNSS